jgi:hypothetical protein
MGAPARGAPVTILKGLACFPDDAAIDEEQSMGQIERAGADLRMDPRVESEGAWIEIEGQKYDVGDVSISGVLVKPYRGTREVGGSFSFQLHLKDDSGGEIAIDGGAVIVRVSDDELAAQFFHLDSDQYPAFDDYCERQFRARLTSH